MAELKISNDLQNVIKKLVLDTYFPVGRLYLTVGSEDPNNTIGGTWVMFGKGKTLVGVDPNDSDFNTVGKTGGEKTHQLKIEEMPSHNHNILKPRWSTGAGANAVYGSNGLGTGSAYDNIGYNGGGQAHNNLQPYITVYFWKRTA